MDLAIILPVKLHTSSQKRNLGLSDTGLPVGIRQISGVTRDALLHLRQAAARIRKARRRTDLTSPIPHGINIQMNGTSYLAQKSPSFCPT